MSIKYNTNTPSKINFNSNEIQKINFNGHTLYTAVPPIIPPVKGDIITIDLLGTGTPQRYRVLKINDNIAEVLSMSNVTTLSFDSGGSNTYEGKTLDTYLNTTWYSTLSNIAKQAIIDKTFRQDSWYYGTQGNPDYQGKYRYSNSDRSYQVSLNSASYGNEITRHCYAISVQDVLDYLETTPQMTQADTTLTYDNVWTMFWNSTTTHSGNLWLRSAYASNTSNAFRVIGDFGNLSDDTVIDDRRWVRPALTIDLTKIDFNIVT